MNVAALAGLRWVEWRSWRDFELRFRWAEITGGLGFALALCLFEEHYSLHVRLGFPNIFIRLPFLQRWHREPRDMMESWGFSLHRDNAHFNWGTATRIIHWPWSWEWVRTSYLLPDGRSWAHDLKRLRRAPIGTASEAMWGSKFTAFRDMPHWSETYPYRYVRRSGEVQERKATVTVSEMEHRWRWFTWLALPRMISRSINIEFDDEVGERSGSWKGGCIGCSYPLRHYETPRECLYRMQEERKFN